MERPMAGISVTELNRLISEALHSEPRIRSVTVTAEVSGFKRRKAVKKRSRGHDAAVVFRKS